MKNDIISNFNYLRRKILNTVEVPWHIFFLIVFPFILFRDKHLILLFIYMLYNLDWDICFYTFTTYVCISKIYVIGGNTHGT